MSSLITKGNAAGTGSVTLESPNTNSDFTISLPAATGTAVVAGQNSAITAATAQTASGSSVDFTSIPSWVKRITVSLDAISFAAAGAARLRIGTSSGLATSGYSTQTYAIQAAAATTSSTSTDGIGWSSTGSAGGTNSGHFVLTNLSGNTWICTQMISRSDSYLLFATGSITLSGTLDRLSLVATTSTFDAGTINILYE
jgi:hypothetical protein